MLKRIEDLVSPPDLSLQTQEEPSLLDRRTFLLQSAKTFCLVTCLGGPLNSLIGCGSTNETNGTELHYDRQTLLNSFEAMLPFFNTVIGGRQAAYSRSAVAAFARSYYELIMYRIPFVGRLERHPLGQTLIESGALVSFYVSLQKFGETKEQATKIIIDAAEARLKSVPDEENRKNGEFKFTDEWYAIQRFAAAKSQQKTYSGDWVFNFIEGAAGEFDWGWDFTECGIVKFYNALGKLELMPAICTQDFIASRLEGTGLERTKTIAEDDGCCNFRYKKGRRVP